MHTVIDKGPKDPGAEPTLPQGQTASPEHDAWAAAKKEFDDWQNAHPDGGMALVRWHDHDAQQAIAADPERYELVPHTDAERRAVSRSRMSLEARVTALETLYDDLVAEDEDADPTPTPKPAPSPQPAPPLFGPTPTPALQPKPAPQPGGQGLVE